MSHGGADPMEQVTFTVPVRIDSGDRLSNLLAVVRLLRRTYPSRIVVGSEEPASLELLVPPGVEIEPIEGSVHLPFHHTRVLNDLSRSVRTPVLVNIETDIVIPESQFREAVRLTLHDDADLVLPYDYAVDIRREERAGFTARTEHASQAEGRTRWHWAVIGGCMVWRTDTFRRVGMENEHFISWGLEDDERIVRTTALGGRFTRVPGPLFHLQHERGADSSDRTPYFSSNQVELERISTRTPAVLAAEVADWPWRTASTSTPVRPVESADLTITIPVRIDHRDRLRNLSVCTRALRNTTTARIIVGVGDPTTVEGALPDGVEVVAVHDPGGPFHRTRILNELTALVGTELMANHDADIVVPIEQWRQALTMLRAGTDLVLPYDGRMRDMPYSHHPWLERAAYDSLPPAYIGMLHEHSVGGCAVWRRASLLAAGMENERFVSWGCEDDERWSRAQRLGLTVGRCDGQLYHLHHERGPDSNEHNPHYAANQAELARIEALDPDGLRADISTWPWRIGPTAP